MTTVSEIDVETPRPGERGKFAAFFFAILVLVLFFWIQPPITFGFDPQSERCLPDLHLAMMVHRQPGEVHRGDLLFWRPDGALAGFKEQYILKMVAGTPGDHLTIRAGRVFINGKQVVQGFPLAAFYGRDQRAFERDEVVPPNAYFMVGVHPNSNDSRYWGYLDARKVSGYAYRLF
ncbi:signal peptidase I [Burkholderia multivorans]|uniref:signal peptidase I n=1 Tax=Burkholderia multivorans TaxID=87883 RepID=UPI001C23CCAF|nr:signal peptidase I [Burkholderia multivorans]MBU9370996.1 signal peptidase I [Burkholderia multivorans]MBU9439447.1 signal peptidase I [Burkholderia multivorans]MBU9680473.1 signal peptidase I [Burkholderia multivorans]MCA8318101.1 signal peptidase I [Burkholderia multivorans]MCA8487805.1 signal peptidase I [Burkholderia multivorans]